MKNILMLLLVLIAVCAYSQEVRISDFHGTYEYQGGLEPTEFDLLPTGVLRIRTRTKVNEYLYYIRKPSSDTYLLCITEPVKITYQMVFYINPSTNSFILILDNVCSEAEVTLRKIK